MDNLIVLGLALILFIFAGYHFGKHAAKLGYFLTKKKKDDKIT